MKAILVSVLLTGIFSINLTALDKSENYLFSIRYLGVKVAEVSLENRKHSDTQGKITVAASSESVGSMLFQLNNQYTSHYRNDFSTFQYNKVINQKAFNMRKDARFDLENGQIEIRENDSLTVIDYDLQSRDFFSSLLYLRTVNDLDSLVIPIYANNNIWAAECFYKGTDTIGKSRADEYLITFQRITDNEYKRSDVLTNNIIKEDSNLTLWFSKDLARLPLKAKFNSSPFPTYWHLEKYTESD